MAISKKTRIRQDCSYQLYTSDFLVRTLDMTDEQVGKFIRLLCYHHQNGHLTEATMLSYCKGRDEIVFSRFLKDDEGLYYNEEMEKEKARRADVSKSKSDNAKAGWEKKKDNDKNNYKVDTYIHEYDDK
jgi:hypothetical protein